MFFVSTAAQVALRMEAMRKAEAGLVALARRFGDHDPSSYTMEVFDTSIPASVLPFKKRAGDGGNSGSRSWSGMLPFGLGGSGGIDNRDEEEQLTMHAIRVKASVREPRDHRNNRNGNGNYPLVIVHGYMNGALYFYRNLASFAGYFGTVFSVDLLGWGLSSRPSIDRLADDSVETAEAFFVESLEAWRSRNRIDKMVLAGHSMGGYLSVAYCEKYPERVDQLLLLSPAGIPEETQADRDRRNDRFLNSVPRRFLYGLFGSLWEGGYTPGSILRSIPESRGKALAGGYVDRRLPVIRDADEKAILSEYMYLGSVLPGSGEYFLSLILDPGAIAKRPCLRRIPSLRVRKVSFLYGEVDWMDVRGGIGVRTLCREAHRDNNDNNNKAPDVEVYRVPNAGHLLMLENPVVFNAAVVAAAASSSSTSSDRRSSASASTERNPLVVPDDVVPASWDSPPPASPPPSASTGSGSGGVAVAAR